MERLRAKVFQSGGSQAVRLPKKLRVDAQEVEIWRDGDELRLRPVPESREEHWKRLWEKIDSHKPDFPEREQPPMPPDRVFFDDD